MMRLQFPDGGVDYGHESFHKDMSSGEGIARGVHVLFSLGCIAAGFSLLSYGPLDLTRTGYNLVTGNRIGLTQELLDYNREQIQVQNPGFSPLEMEKNLAGTLEYTLQGNSIDVEDVRLDRLWDASEDHASSLYQRWVWTSLGK